MLIPGIRAFILYLAMIIVMRMMGKSAIGQLEPFEFVLVILIADLISVPMEDIAVPLYSGVLPLVTIMFMQIVFSWLAMKYKKFRMVLSGQPSVVINKGNIEEKELRRIRVSIDDIIEQIRIQGHANLSDIEFAILEVSGNISVIQKNTDSKQKQQLHLPAVLINDGVILKKKLEKLNIKSSEVDQVLKKNNITDYDQCLILYRETDGSYYVQAKEKYLNRKKVN